MAFFGRGKVRREVQPLPALKIDGLRDRIIVAKRGSIEWAHPQNPDSFDPEIEGDPPHRRA